MTPVNDVSASVALVTLIIMTMITTTILLMLAREVHIHSLMIANVCWGGCNEYAHCKEGQKLSQGVKCLSTPCMTSSVELKHATGTKSIFNYITTKNELLLV